MKNNHKSEHYCTLYIARHGETEWNVEHRLQGQKDSPLTEKGLLQAKILAEKLSLVHFDAVYSSDLLRAKRTAEIVALEKKLAVATTALLREHNYDKYEGMRVDDVKRELKMAFEEYERLSNEEKFRYRLIPNGETDEEITARFITFLREIAVMHESKTVLVVSHGGIMSAFLVHLGFGKPEHVRIDNTGYFKLFSDGVDFFVEDTEGITVIS